MNAVKDRRQVSPRGSTARDAPRRRRGRKPALRVVPAPRRPTRPKRRLPFLIMAFAVVAVMVTGVVSLQALVSQTAFRMQELQDRSQELQSRTDELRLEGAQLSAPERIEREAHRMGFEYPAPDDVHTIVVRARPRHSEGAGSLFAIERLLGTAP